MSNWDPVAGLATAQAIGVSADTGRAPVLTRTFDLDEGHGAPIRAVLSATAHGIFEARLNGHPVSPALFTPGWTAYEWRLQVNQFDITPLLDRSNRLDVLLGNGWWRGNLGFAAANANYGERLALLASVTIEYADGHRQTIDSGPDWTATASQVVSNSIYNGEAFDFTLAPQPLVVETLDVDRTVLVPVVGPSVTRQESRRPQRI